MGSTSSGQAGSADVVRYGVIGTGMMGVEHINNLLALPGAQVVAVADPVEQSRDWAQLAVGLDTPLHRFVDHRDLLDSGLCDAVVVASPNHTHLDVLLDVLAAGVHVLVEKPLCTTVADCQRVVAAVEALPPQQVVWMGLEYRYMPSTARLVDEVRAGTVGPVRMVAIREHRFPFLPKVGDWNRFSANTGGTLVEKCCHFFDLMNLVIDRRPVRVMASGGQDVNHLDERYPASVVGGSPDEMLTPDILDNAYVVVEYDGGARALLDLCMFAEASRNEQEISVVGDRGKVEALVTESVLRIGRRTDGIGRVTELPVGDDRIAHQGLHHGASYLEHVDFLAAIRSGAAPGVTVVDGLWSVVIGAAAHRSIDLGRPVLIDEML
jgi:myo-inositol 2-dehydrogenase/D-chiro-inositol 1-dehydrogenase